MVLQCTVVLDISFPPSSSEHLHEISGRDIREKGKKSHYPQDSMVLFFSRDMAENVPFFSLLALIYVAVFKSTVLI